MHHIKIVAENCETKRPAERRQKLSLKYLYRKSVLNGSDLPCGWDGKVDYGRQSGQPSPLGEPEIKRARLSELGKCENGRVETLTCGQALTFLFPGKNEREDGGLIAAVSDA